MAVNAADTSIVHLQVGDQVFITTMGTLNTSPVLAAKFSQRWNPSAAPTSANNSAPGEDPKPQKLFLDANPEIFQHILDYLRHNVTPMIWDPKQGFDSNKYAAIYQMARYYGSNELAEWIKAQKYKSAVSHRLTYKCLNADGLHPTQANHQISDADHVDIHVVKLKGVEWVCPAGRSDHTTPTVGNEGCERSDRKMTSEVHAKLLLERETVRVLVIRSHSILNADLLDA